MENVLVNVNDLLKKITQHKVVIIIFSNSMIFVIKNLKYFCSIMVNLVWINNINLNQYKINIKYIKGTNAQRM